MTRPVTSVVLALPDAQGVGEVRVGVRLDAYGRLHGMCVSYALRGEDDAVAIWIPGTALEPLQRLLRLAEDVVERSPAAADYLEDARCPRCHGPWTPDPSTLALQCYECDQENVGRERGLPLGVDGEGEL